MHGKDPLICCEIKRGRILRSDRNYFWYWKSRQAKKIIASFNKMESIEIIIVPSTTLFKICKSWGHLEADKNYARNLNRAAKLKLVGMYHYILKTKKIVMDRGIRSKTNFVLISFSNLWTSFKISSTRVAKHKRNNKILTFINRKLIWNNFFSGCPVWKESLNIWCTSKNQESKISCPWNTIVQLLSHWP